MSPESWQKPNTEAQKPAPRQKVESVESLEQKLSPEQMEQIMAKVQDINKVGTGLHAFTRALFDGKSTESLLLRVMQEGLLGGFLKKNSQEGYKEYTKKDWHHNARKRSGAVVFFNIVGRDIKKIEDSEWLSSQDLDLSCSLIFDTSHLTENRDFKNYPVEYNGGKREKLVYKINVFGPNASPGEDELFLNEKQKEEILKNPRLIIPHKSEGYALTFRVAPRRFLGIILKLNRPPTEEELKDIAEEKRNYALGVGMRNVGSLDEFINTARIQNKTIENNDNKDKEVKAQEIASYMASACKGKDERLLPIYDSHGNLLWPKRITYEEVKEFVVERDAKDKNKEE